MKKIMLWTVTGIAAAVVLIILALVLIPNFVDLGNYRPEIEKQLIKATGRNVSLGKDLHLSLFPWASLTFTDLHIGNPVGFAEKDFIAIQSFEARIKLLPLLFKDIQIKRFALKGPIIVLEKQKDGQASWQIAESKKETKPDMPKQEEGKEISLKALTMEDFSITDGSILWIDHGSGMRYRVDNFMLKLKDVSLERPIEVLFGAKLENQPFSLQGTIGPLGKELGRGTIPLNISVKALDQIDMRVEGQLRDPAGLMQADVLFTLAPFSPQSLFKALEKPFPVQTADPSVLKHLGIQGRIQADPDKIFLKEAVVELDQSTLKLEASVQEFAKPNLGLNADLDAIDLDRYLPPTQEAAPPQQGVEPLPTQKIDYAPLRKMLLNADFRIGKLQVAKARLEDIRVTVSGKNGQFMIDPMDLRLYEGAVAGKSMLDFRQDIPEIQASIQASGIQANPLLKDVAQKDFLEGVARADIALKVQGDDPIQIRKTLNGQGELVFSDGAIKGIDLASMVRNVQTAFGLAEKSDQRPRTDFSELACPFTITDGVADVKASLKSPLIRVDAKGQADLVKEMLDFRVEPKFVATLKGQGDIQPHTGIMVPVKITGSFADPSFRPDLEGMFKQKLPQKAIEGVPQLPVEDLKKSLPFSP